jgi:predicted HicB family RNase H-like nuclease
MKPLQYKGCLGSVECNPEENCLHGRILYINDLVTYEAQTPAELKASFEASVDDYLETCEQVGKVPEKSFKGTFNVRMTPELHKAAAVAAAIQETTLNDFVAQAVADKLAMQKKKRWSREPYLAVAEENEPYKTKASRD